MNFIQALEIMRKPGVQGNGKVYHPELPDGYNFLFVKDGKITISKNEDIPTIEDPLGQLIHVPYDYMPMSLVTSERWEQYFTTVEMDRRDQLSGIAYDIRKIGYEIEKLLDKYM